MTLRISLLISALSVAVSCSRITNVNSVVDLSYGSFQGNTTGDITSFLGIPFAQAPVGKLRFALPQSPKKLNGIQQATSFGASCPQQDLSAFNISGVDLPFSSAPVPDISEDCLSVNVIKPSTVKAGDALPVLFWIYGGGFEVGYATQYPINSLVERSIALGQPVIYVSANYRLNAFGFLSSKEVKDAGVGNLGLQDQRFALKWVQENIYLFGGDPSRVIIWGESAGAISVGLQMVIRDGNTEGLFHGAFMESGSPIFLPDITNGQTYYDQLVEEANCTNETDTLECLRGVPADIIMDFANNTPNIFNYSSLNLVWQPSVDGNLIPRNPQDSIVEGLYARIPVVSGDCDDEGTLFSLPLLNITTDQEFLGYIQSNYLKGATASELESVAQAYPSNVTLGSPFDTGTANAITPEFKRLAAFLGDWVFQAPRRFLLQTISETQDTWGFLYKRGKSSNVIGTVHSSDVPEFYGFEPGSDFIGTDALINFAYTLNPNNPQNPKSLLSSINWPKWNTDPDAPPLLTFIDPAPNVTITADTYRESAMDLLNQLSRTLF